MYVVQLRDGSREEFNAPDRAEAMREAIRRQALALELECRAVLTRPDMLLALGLDRAGLFEAFAPGWEPPTGAEVRELLKVAQLTSSTAGRLVGVPGGKVRKWAGDDGSMPYAVWRLLAVYARQAPAVVMEINKELTN